MAGSRAGKLFYITDHYKKLSSDPWRGCLSKLDRKTLKDLLTARVLRIGEGKGTGKRKKEKKGENGRKKKARPAQKIGQRKRKKSLTRGLRFARNALAAFLRWHIQSAGRGFRTHCVRTIHRPAGYVPTATRSARHMGFFRRLGLACRGSPLAPPGYHRHRAGLGR